MSGENHNSSVITTIFWVLLTLFAVVLFRTAWLSDDAFITFRVVDNFFSGYGLRWNIDERVQVFTHPLWLFLLIAVRALTGEIVISTMILSVAVSFGAVLLLTRFHGKGSAATVAALTAILLSRAFVDYSTSGLENPLSFLLLAIFFWLYFQERRMERPFRGSLLLWLLAGAVLLNRLDLLLLIGPALAAELYRHRAAWLPMLGGAALGLLPLLGWLVFSTIYYGFPLPNTAYAKLDPHLSQNQKFAQGVVYLLDSLASDPLTLFVIVFATGLALHHRRWESLSLVIGIALTIAYLLRIGGGFMSGRFLAAPFFCAIILFLRVAPSTQGPALIMAGGFALAGFMAGAPPLFTDAGHGSRRAQSGSREWPATGIADERAFYFQKPHHSLIRSTRTQLYHGVEPYQEGQPPRHLDTEPDIGYQAFRAGPQAIFIDYHGLTDPLLARLPSISLEDWRPGHMENLIPEGYIESRVLGHDKLTDRRLADYYEEIRLVTAGPLWSRDRWNSIWDLNFHSARSFLNVSDYRSPSREDLLRQEKTSKWLYVSWNDFSRPVKEGADGSADGVLEVRGHELMILLPRPNTSPIVEVSVSRLVSMDVEIMAGDQKIHGWHLPYRQKDIERHEQNNSFVGRRLDETFPVLDRKELKIPEEDRGIPYDRVFIDFYSTSLPAYVGHLRLLSDDR